MRKLSRQDVDGVGKVGIGHRKRVFEAVFEYAVFFTLEHRKRFVLELAP
ncbi:nicotinate phosphoribosyltransferase [Mycolicibacterium fortuitum subsp. acetamidolyticum]|uniref:Nicotinate phosphoribosyltransferase n=1 Tax=Mycolicibacterium fortuitum subsp. acetamidolyticum TaxID=144550 RepID=A0A124E4Q1_MYCFO|nr:nicotinate phosphoribosyltransferase [Mycolicibacterium fortuitum subsp. acetamidolyticum]